jgi:3-keto-disaccharide hydrolase
MQRQLIAVSFACGLLGSAGMCLADKDATLTPALAQPGKLMVEDSFDGPALAKKWKVNKGTWEIADGVVVASEKASDNHAAVLTLAQPNHDSVIRFSFRLDGAKGLHLSFNHAKGHLFRVIVTEKAVTITTDKDKNDPASKAVKLASAPTAFEQGKWYTMLVELKGNSVQVQTDAGLKLKGSDPSLDVDKTGYRFVMRGATLKLDDVKVWSAGE